MNTESEVAEQSKQMDPYHLKEYQSDYVPADGGQAPLPKTAEPEAYHDNRIYVSNIPFTFTDFDLTDLFGRFGDVRSAMIVCNERGSKGFGFVTMDSVDSCETARKNLHGTKILGRIIEVRKATPLARPPHPKRGPTSVASSCASSPRRNPAKTQLTKKKLQPTEIAINPHKIPSASLGMQPESPRVSQRHVPAPITPFPNIINQANALNLLFGENPFLLQSLLPPAHIQNQLFAHLNTPLPQAFFPPPTMYPGQMAPSFLHCTIPPLQQAQDGFAYRVASLPQQYANSCMMAAAGGYFVDQKQHYRQTPGSLNNSMLNNTMNNTMISNSMNAHMQGMQDQLANLLNLDGTLNQSKLSDFKVNNSNSSLLSTNSSSSRSLSTDSSRKRRNNILPDGESPKKIIKFHDII